ncbi:hypothetical protein [Bacteroides sp. 51]|uniref:hypothetical protein n=1 Tax=Bacteroides sp. 51 TaxID=2302938 RepID=UPI0013D300E7|nr:hypothetical protein [Bacteroides sp. 51]NDV82227.1 hypothetical protein [Bacteroides sp. 51]
MARNKNDGKGRIGGRGKGTPNKVTTDLKTWISTILDNGREQFVLDMGLLEPAERIRVYTSLVNYVLPKQQAVNVQNQVEAEYDALAKLIEKAPDEFVDRIAAKVMELHKLNKDDE